MRAILALDEPVFAATRLPCLARPGTRAARGELAAWAVAGIVAAAALAFVKLRAQMPGHAIMFAVLSQLAGYAIAPRRGAGLVMAACSGLAAMTISTASWGHIGPPSLAGLLAFGPLFDLATSASASRNASAASSTALATGARWRLWLRCAAVGLGANLVAFIVRVVLWRLGLDDGGKQFGARWWWYASSYLIWGAAAGLLAAMVCFRIRPERDVAGGITS